MFFADLLRFEILQFFVTLLMCGLVIFFPTAPASQVAISLVVSIAMAISFANFQPYISLADDMLAQACQHSLTMVLIVGLLNMTAAAEGNSNGGPNGAVLVTMTAGSIAMGVGLIVLEFVEAVAPGAMNNMLTKFQESRTSYTFAGGRWAIMKAARLDRGKRNTKVANILPTDEEKRDASIPPLVEQPSTVRKAPHL